MIRINYITNLDVNNYSGGWSGMNYHVHDQLSRQFDVHLVQNVNPPFFLSDRIISKAFRIAGLKGNFPAFTEQRLSRIKAEVESKLHHSAQLNFYHGATPWLHVENKIPYALYLDCSFSTYISVYHQQRHFDTKQLGRLFTKEAEFLKNACCVFFSSKWALNEAKNGYRLDGRNFFVAGLGGGMEIENTRSEYIEPYFLFIGMDFFGKGGDVAAEAFETVRKEFPQFSLKIAGQEPPEKYKAIVQYEGRFNKSDKTQLCRLKKLFSDAFCFVLPTSKDMTPLVLVEASSVGCPVIATNSFGIPELVTHNETGLLIDASMPLKEQLVKAMKEMITNKQLRERCITSSPSYIRDNFTWSRTGKIIAETLSSKLS
jgi:glycosyltransferase involved in cell wall biosynthesis